ncbi:hypothetical protein JR065_20000 [Xanthomonas sp. AmX2]|uniref:hypothetical protein n=1 Tax=Xanthomonas sp. TaxID=29446 RepID=UPI00197CC063|nr:hypothetical protein [Xanthomonas sp.]MBN6152621.1 hypothetical protein [Xanthomonas sp.]
MPIALGLALVAATLHLGWEYTHGGVKSHHLLDRADLPAISNWWGLIVLPLLGGLAGRTIGHRARSSPSALPRALVAFVAALAAGVALSMAFVAGNESAASALFLGILVSGLVIPAYRAEYGFGFVLGMTFVFGSVLPGIIALVVAGISAAAHRLAWPAAMWLARRARGRAAGAGG